MNDQQDQDVDRAVPRVIELARDRADALDRACPIADGRNDPILDRLAGQILARPVGDMQSLGDRLQAGQLNDLGALQGRKSGPLVRPVGVVPEGRASRSVRSDGRSSRRTTDRIACGWPMVRSAPQRRRPGGSEPVGFDTRAVTDSERSAGASGHLGGRSTEDGVFGHAWGGSNGWGQRSVPAYQPARISCITYFELY